VDFLNSLSKLPSPSLISPFTPHLTKPFSIPPFQPMPPFLGKGSPSPNLCPIYWRDFIILVSTLLLFYLYASLSRIIKTKTRKKYA